MSEQIPAAMQVAVRELVDALEEYDLANLMDRELGADAVRRCGEAEARVRELFGIPFREPASFEPLACLGKLPLTPSLEERL